MSHTQISKGPPLRMPGTVIRAHDAPQDGFDRFVEAAGAVVRMIGPLFWAAVIVLACAING